MSEPRPVEIFYCYSRKDEQLRAKLDAHLSSLRRSDLVRAWYDRDISPGTDWRNQIERRLDSADLILLLVSADFMRSDFCYSVEMKRAIERHEKGEARVIPIILKPVDWEGAPFGKLQALPANGCPITDSRNRDKAFMDVALGIRGVVNEIIASRQSSKGTILAIEDDPEVLEGYVLYLEDAGYRVLRAVTGAEGKRLLGEHPDTRLIILDLGLPDTTGEDWLEWHWSQGRRIPVIVASGAGTILRVTKGNDLTAAITKPFHMHELQELIDALLAEV